MSRTCGTLSAWNSQSLIAFNLEIAGAWFFRLRSESG